MLSSDGSHLASRSGRQQRRRLVGRTVETGAALRAVPVLASDASRANGTRGHSGPHTSRASTKKSTRMGVIIVSSGKFSATIVVYRPFIGRNFYSCSMLFLLNRCERSPRPLTVSSRLRRQVPQDGALKPRQKSPARIEDARRHEHVLMKLPRARLLQLQDLRPFPGGRGSIRSYETIANIRLYQELKRVRWLGQRFARPSGPKHLAEIENSMISRAALYPLAAASDFVRAVQVSPDPTLAGSQARPSMF